MSRRTIILLVIALVVLVPSGLVLTGVIRPRGQAQPRPVQLTWWTIDDSAETLQPILAAYRGLHPYIQVTVEKRRPETYEQDLKEAWAKDQGPDIFSLPNTSVSSFKDFVSPMPKETRVAYYRQRRLFIREEAEIMFRIEPSLTPRQVRSQFVEVVGKDVILPNGVGVAVYGLPLSIDTLLLFYNRDLLNSAGIVEPPVTWQELVEQVPKLTLQDTEGGLARPGIALGLAANVSHAFDILSLLMLQNGAQMVDPTGQEVTFQRARAEGDNPGLGALTFYTDFAQTNPPKEVYTWSTKFPSAHDLFQQGKLAYAFGYQRDRVRISQGSPTLNFGVAPVPHIHENELDNDAAAPVGDQLRKITYGRYWVQAVSRKARNNADEAWNLLQFAATGERNVSYLTATQQVAALTKTLKTQLNDPDLTVPAGQASAARSWYHGTNLTRVEEYFASLIEDVASKGVDPQRALDLASEQVQTTYPE